MRLSAEAFSYLTLRGIAGEPLKVVLLGDRVDPRQATAAVALERIAYLVGTTVIVGIGSMLALAGLALSRPWFRVFRALAIAAAVVSLFTAIVITGRGTYLRSLLERFDAIFGTSVSTGRVSRFITAVERQMLELVRGNPRRLAVLITATVAAYVCMALEAWVILRAVGAPITPNGALAVETFSRVASFASAFIPANLGALEASSLAAVAAVGVGGGAALALARRLRGLLWAGIGLAIYPRRSGGRAAAAEPAARPARPDPPATLLYFPLDPDAPVSPMARLAGLPICERVLRPAVRAGYGRVIVWVPHNRANAPAPDRRLQRLAREFRHTVTVTEDETEWRLALEQLPPGQPVTVIGAGTVVSTALFAEARTIAPAPSGTRDVAAGGDWRESGLLRMTASAAMSPAVVIAALGERRRRAQPLPSGKDVADGLAKLALRIVTSQDLADAEQTIRRASYKDTDAKLARFNRRMSLPISIALIPTPLTANQLSVILVALGFYSAWLFGTGHYLAGVLGAFLSLSASVLDGCDGEIARLKYQESALGCWIETFGDYSSYVAIFVGLTIGAVHQTGWEAFYWVGALALAGMLVSFALLIFLRNRITGGQPEKLHSIAKARFKSEPTFWSRIVWRISFVATRAAMPYGIMALALVYALPFVVFLAAIGSNVYWISLVLKLRHLLGRQAEQSVTA